MNKLFKMQVFTPAWSCVLLIVLLGKAEAAGSYERIMEDWESWPIEKLEQEMSPSRWNPEKSPDGVIMEYIQVSINGTENAKKEIPHELNIPYGDKPAEQYDIYGTDLPKNAPTFLWIHGGYWQEGSKDISGLIAPALAKMGVRNIVFGYTLAPSASLEEIGEELATALKNAMERFPGSKFTIGGHSAGAQLAAMLLHKTYSQIPNLISQLEGLVLVSGIYDLRLLVPTYVNIPLKLTRASAETLSPLKIQTIVPEILTKSPSFRVLVIVGTYDSPEYQRQAEEYFNVLKASLPLVEFWKSPTDDHFTLVQQMGVPGTEVGTTFLNFAQDFTNSIRSSGPILRSTASGLATVITSLIACSYLL